METSVKETGSHIDAVGTSRKGEIYATLDELINAFGMPIMGGAEDKVSKEWTILFTNGDVATIYDWKEHYPNDGSRWQWNTGGHHIRVTAMIAAALLEAALKAKKLDNTKEIK